jgi:predicted nucleic acid-binding protein
MTINVIDTNVVLRYLLADHPEFFKRASQLMSEVQSGKRKAYLAESVAAECIFVLTKFYKVPKDEAAGKLRQLLDYKARFKGCTHRFHRSQDRVRGCDRSCDGAPQQLASRSLR